MTGISNPIYFHKVNVSDLGAWLFLGWVDTGSRSEYHEGLGQTALIAWEGNGVPPVVVTCEE